MQAERSAMQRVAQEHPTGCGPACIAMLAHQSYRSVTNRAQKLDLWDPRRGFRSYCHELARLAESYGLYLEDKIEFSHQFREIGLKLEDFQRDMSRRSLDQHAIVAIDRKLRGRGQDPRWHWVVWDDEQSRVLDPNRVRRRLPIRPWYYIPVRYQ